MEDFNDDNNDDDSNNDEDGNNNDNIKNMISVITMIVIMMINDKNDHKDGWRWSDNENWSHSAYIRRISLDLFK